MRQLLLAVYAEGPTDARSLPILVRRTAERIIRDRGTSNVEVLQTRVVKVEKKDRTRAECILSAARQTAGYHALAIHCDADKRNPEDAFDERYAPGLHLVNERTDAEEKVCGHLFPLIPVRMTESWMLADPEVLIEVIGTSTAPDDLSLPPPQKIESVGKPKRALEAVIRQAVPSRRRRRNIQVGRLFEPVARLIRIDRLEKVDSFVRFRSDLAKVLLDFHMIE